ncbi:MAG: carboxypeptidase-like regulatory domain-containing protein [Candidatus Brocadiaceae bacterium]|nr:carboxypeptidase-like regulatory domain-containing protein [Candidatus Brocadiaceae bacterium]
MQRKSRSLIFLFVFLSAIFPILGHTNVLFAGPAGSISGSVMGADGNPLVGVEVEVIDNKGAVIASTKASKDGSFSFNGLEAGKTYKVKTFYGKDVDSTLVTAVAGPSKPVALKLSNTKGVKVLVGNPGPGGAGGFPTWGVVLIGVGVIGAAAGGAAAAGAFGGKGKAVSP